MAPLGLTAAPTGRNRAGGGIKPQVPGMAAKRFKPVQSRRKLTVNLLAAPPRPFNRAAREVMADRHAAR